MTTRTRLDAGIEIDQRCSEAGENDYTHAADISKCAIHVRITLANWSRATRKGASTDIPFGLFRRVAYGQHFLGKRMNGAYRHGVVIS
jgi:hypothetical protein